jgi:hypothetical protein
VESRRRRGGFQAEGRRHAGLHRRPQIDHRLPWLIARFVDPEAGSSTCLRRRCCARRRRRGDSYDVPDVHFSHDGGYAASMRSENLPAHR